MSILIALLVFCLIAGLVWYLIGMLPLPAPFGTVVRVILILIAIVWLVSYLGPFPGLHGRF
jgi:hypothetical protein